jgi:hypothetical protein
MKSADTKQGIITRISPMLASSWAAERAPNNELRIVNPRLPEFLTFLELRNLRIGKSWLDLDFLRQHDRTSCRVVGRRGEELTVNIMYR